MPSEIPIHDANDITLGEVYRYLLSFEKRVIQQMKAMDDRTNGNSKEFLREDIYEVRHTELEKRITALEEKEQSSISYRRAMIQSMTAAICGAVVGSGIAAIVASIH